MAAAAIRPRRPTGAGARLGAVLLASHEGTEVEGTDVAFWWAYPLVAVVVIGLLTWRLLPETEEAGGPNKAARGALVLLVLAWIAWLLWPEDAVPGTTRAKLEGLLYLAAVSGFLGGIVFAGIGAANVRRQGDRAIAAAAIAVGCSPPLYLVWSLVVCFIETPGCFS